MQKVKYSYYENDAYRRQTNEGWIKGTGLLHGFYTDRDELDQKDIHRRSGDAPVYRLYALVQTEDGRFIKLKPNEIQIDSPEVDRVLQLRGSAQEEAESITSYFKQALARYWEYKARHVNGFVDIDAEFARTFANGAVKLLIEQEQMYTNGQPEPVKYWEEVKRCLGGGCEL